MTLKKTGLNDSDKIFVTVALWITAVTLFITALTLPMLPSEVMIFYRTVDGNMPEKYSKFNNLFLVLITLVPTVIILIASGFKRHNRLQNSFTSVMLFSIMLSISIGCIVIYGIMQQFDASGNIKNVNSHGIAVLIVTFFASLVSSAYPGINRSRQISEEPPEMTYMQRVRTVADKFWNVGAYGYLFVAMVSSFVPNYFAYIPLAVGIVVHLVFLFAFKPKPHAARTEQAQQ